MKYLYIVFLLFVFPQAFAASINVYVRLDDPTLIKSVTEFNNELKRRGIFERYGFEPFLSNYPMHATLYLAQYTDDQVGKVVEAARQLACRSHPIKLETTGLSLTSGNYVMLDINNDVTPKNPPLQQLSDEATLKLAVLRDYNAPIPDWAQTLPEKRKAFERYGSPNVFFEFSPHLSLMAPVFNDAERARAFQGEMQAIINAWQFPNLTIASTVLGVGYANEQGQVTNEIAHFNLGCGLDDGVA